MNAIKNKEMTMSDIVNDLDEAMRGGVVSFSFAVNEKGGSDIGVRKSGKVGVDGLRDVGITTEDGTAWLIAGDIIDSMSREKFTNVSRVFATPVANMNVRLRAQAMVNGRIVVVGLGTHEVKFCYMITPECGQLLLK